MVKYRRVLCIASATANESRAILKITVNSESRTNLSDIILFFYSLLVCTIIKSKKS